ncbi:hypothetical protein [Deinococcus sp. LM3]|uniref:hypothetical protein n=1 Tax=Deinococcus sp. LM3 TaxID=1938608 RepID=UPI000993054A|nr:hypothetical protein [Deinococcus sp. LM3]OOV12452.1 hypothetical protein BXU09_16790 [Deinococcus sp. LM3]
MALQNLRVELSNLRRMGVDLGPSRAPLLSAQATTDLDAWEQQLDQDLSTWLGSLGERVLDGLDEPGNAGLTLWLGQQRQEIADRIEAALQRRFDIESGRAPSNAALIQTRAAQLGLNVTGRAGTERALPWTAAAVAAPIQMALSLAQRQPHLLIYTGRHASGRQDTVSAVLTDAGWRHLAVTASRSPRHLLASLLLQLRLQLPPDLQEQTDALLGSLGNDEYDQLKLCQLLMRWRNPVALILTGAEALNAETAPMLEFMLNWPLQLLIVAVARPSAEGSIRQLFGQHVGIGRVSSVPAAELSSDAVASMCSAPDANHLEILRQSEGWLPAIPFLAAEASGVSRRVRFSPPLLHLLLSDVHAATGHEPRHYARLAGLSRPFTEPQAVQILAEDGVTAAEIRTLLRIGLRSGILERVPAQLTVAASGVIVRALDGEQPLDFSSEQQRAALAGLLDGEVRRRLRTAFGIPIRYAPGGQLWPVRISSGPCATPTGACIQESGAAPDSLLEPESAHLLGCGFRLLQRGPLLTLMRLGLSDRAAPTVALTFPAPSGPPDGPEHSIPDAVWRWSLDFRISVPRELGSEVPVAVRVHLPGQSGPDLLRPGLLSDDQSRAAPPPPLQAGQWYRMEGPGSGSSLEFICTAPDLLVQVTDVQLTC